MMVTKQRIVLALVIILSPVQQKQEAAAFAPPTATDIIRCRWHSSSSSFKYYYGPNKKNDGEEDIELLPPSGSSPLLSTNNIPNDNHQEADALCDFEDVDCQAFLPTHTITSSSSSSSDTYLASQLKSRSESLQQERIEHNWNVAHCPTSFIHVSNSDYIRRVGMETYPIAVCGGARGGVYVINLENKIVLGKAEGVHISQVEEEPSGSSRSSSSSTSNNHATMAKEAMEKLYGKLDGGGVVSVAIHGDIIASSGREGGVRLWKLLNQPSTVHTTTSNDDDLDKEEHSAMENINNNNSLVPLGTIPGLDHTIVTCLKFDSMNRLWTACFDGTVRAYNLAECMDATTTTTTPAADTEGGVFPARMMPLFQSDFTDSVLDMHLCEELQLGVCATADGGAALFHMYDGQFFAGIILSEASSSSSARSVLILKHRNSRQYSVLCGTSDGVIHSLPLNVIHHHADETATAVRIDEENPFRVSETTDTAIKPRHVGPVMCMTSPGDGRFVSGGQDGALRIWNCSNTDDVGRYSTDDATRTDNDTRETIQQTKCMYALTGYKLWLGSACTDGKHLVSDGGENSVVVRDFSSEPKAKNGKASV